MRLRVGTTWNSKRIENGAVSLYRVHSLFGRTNAFVLSRIRLRKLACTRYRDTTKFYHAIRWNLDNPALCSLSSYALYGATLWQPARLKAPGPLQTRGRRCCWLAAARRMSVVMALPHRHTAAARSVPTTRGPPHSVARLPLLVLRHDRTAARPWAHGSPLGCRPVTRLDDLAGALGRALVPR
jgi:hypothetical protein